MKRPAALGIKPRTPGLCIQCSAAELRQLPTLTILYMYCTGGTEMPQLHTWQPLSMCCQNSIRGRPHTHTTHTHHTHIIKHEHKYSPPTHTHTHTSVVMMAICEGVMAPEMTFCLRLGLRRSPRLATRLRTFILYLLPVSLNSEKISEHQLRKMVSKRTGTIDLTLHKLSCTYRN